MNHLDRLKQTLREAGARVLSVNTVINQHAGRSEQTFYEVAGHPLILIEYGADGWEVFRPVTAVNDYNATIEAVMEYCAEAKKEPKL